jgi:hypothetical protein
MAEEKSKSHDSADFVSRLVKNPGTPPSLLFLSGFSGASSEKGHRRLYFDPQLSQFVDFPEGDVLHEETVSREQSPLGGSHVWLKKDAKLIYSRQPVGVAGLEATALCGRPCVALTEIQPVVGNLTPNYGDPAAFMRGQVFNPQFLPTPAQQGPQPTPSAVHHCGSFNFICPTRPVECTGFTGICGETHAAICQHQTWICPPTPNCPHQTGTCPISANCPATIYCPGLTINCPPSIGGCQGQGQGYGGPVPELYRAGIPAYNTQGCPVMIQPQNPPMSYAGNCFTGWQHCHY